MGPTAKLLRAGLAIVGTICLLCFVSFSGSGGHGEIEFNLGFPDHWFVWKNDGFAFTLTRWSVAIGLAGVACWYAFFRLRRTDRPGGESQ